MIDCVTVSEWRYPNSVRKTSIEAPRHLIFNLEPSLYCQNPCVGTMVSTSRAVICTGKGKAAVKEVPVPSIRDGYVLVKVKALGLNPTDWKSIHSGGATGTKIGVCMSWAMPRGSFVSAYEASRLPCAHKWLTRGSAIMQE